MYEPLVTMGYLAAVTRRIVLGTSVLVLPMRNPFVVAKQVATLQQLSGGRIVLGVGIGWEEREFAAVGADFRTRAARTDEAIGLLRHLFGGGAGPYPGRYYGYETGVFAPRPTVPIPIMAGGISDPTPRRAARFADQWQGFGLDPDGFRGHAAWLRERQRPGSRAVSPGIRIDWSGLEATADLARAFRAAGAEHLALHFGEAEGYGERMTGLIAAVLGGV